MILRRRLLKIAPGVAVVGLASCGSPPAQYFRLSPLPGPILNTGEKSIRVRNINIPGYLNQNNIAKPSPAYQFAFNDNTLWAEPLTDMLQSTLVQNLAQRLPGATVTGSGAIGVQAGLLVEINILRFDPDPSGSIVLMAQIALKNSDGNFMVTKTVQSSAVPASNDVAETAATMSALWAGLANEIAVYATE